MAYCPNCRTSLAPDATSCANCSADFTSADGWKPHDYPSAEAGPGGSWSLAGIVACIGLASVLVPFAAVALGLLVSYCLPGCRCDEGAGCHGCGADYLLSMLLFDGFPAGMFGLMFVLPGSLVLAGALVLLRRQQ